MFAFPNSSVIGRFATRKADVEADYRPKRVRIRTEFTDLSLIRSMAAFTFTENSNLPVRKSKSFIKRLSFRLFLYHYGCKKTQVRSAVSAASADPLLAPRVLARRTWGRCKGRRCAAAGDPAAAGRANGDRPWLDATLPPCSSLVPPQLRELLKLRDPSAFDSTDAHHPHPTATPRTPTKPYTHLRLQQHYRQLQITVCIETVQAAATKIQTSSPCRYSQDRNIGR